MSVVVALGLSLGLLAGSPRVEAAEGAGLQARGAGVATSRRGFFRRAQFRRGDGDTNGSVQLTDGLAILDFLFLGAASLPCFDAGDTNGDGALDLSDVLYLFAYLFVEGPPPPAPGPSSCDVNRATDALPCRTYSACPDDFPLISHVLNRVTFGPTEELYSRIRTRAELLQYLEEQINPPTPYDQAIHEPEIFNEVENLGFRFPDSAPSAQAKVNRLSGSLLVNAVKSRWQLLHVVAHFWNNHFHTQIGALVENFFASDPRGGRAVRTTEESFLAADADASGAITESEWNTFRTRAPGITTWAEFTPDNEDGFVTLEEYLRHGSLASWKYGGDRSQFGVAADLERREYDLYRRLAFGDFRSLLESCAKSPAMLIYLNGFENTVLAPNENYAREFLELFSLGADHVYTQRDIEELARIFTSWTVDWVARAPYAPDDINFLGLPGSLRVPLETRIPDVPAGLAFPTRENWDDELYTWAFVLGHQQKDGGHDWGRKDLFLPQFGGVDSLGNPQSALNAVAVPANNGLRTVDSALSEFDLVLDRVVTSRDCAKFISTKLIQLFVADDLALLRKSRPLPEDLQRFFNAADVDGNGTIEAVEWTQPIALVLPNGRPPEIFTLLDVDGDGRLTTAEYKEPDLLLDCIDTWRSTGGNIQEVLRTILFADEFLSMKFYGAKVKTPFELVASTLRALEADFTEPLLVRMIEDIAKSGMVLFDFADPTGESELAVDHVHTVGLLERFKFVNRGVMPSNAADERFVWNLAGALNRWNIDTAADAIDFFALLLVGGDILSAHRQLALSLSLSPTPEQVGFLLSLPGFQQQ